MNYQDLLTAVLRLPLDERQHMLETISQSLRAEVLVSPRAATPAEQLRGMLKPDGALPTDEALQTAYIDYLTEKYQ